MESSVRGFLMPRDGESFGKWLIDRVQKSTGDESIFSGDDNRVRHIEKEFHESAGLLVQWAVAKAREMAIQ